MLPRCKDSCRNSSNSYLELSLRKRLQNKLSVGKVNTASKHRLIFILWPKYPFDKYLVWIPRKFHSFFPDPIPHFAKISHTAPQLVLKLLSPEAAQTHNQQDGFTSGGMRELLPPRSMSVLMKGSLKPMLSSAKQQPKSVITSRGQPAASKRDSSERSAWEHLAA